MTCTSKAELKAAKFYIGVNLGFSLFEFFTFKKILTLTRILSIGTEDDNVPSADSLNDLDQIEEVDEGLDEVPDNEDDDNDDIVSDYEPQSGGIMSRQDNHFPFSFLCYFTLFGMKF